MANSWKITLADGTVLDNLELNGNNFISKTEVTEDTFNGKLTKVVIEGPKVDDGFGDYGLAGEHGLMQLARCQNDPGLGGYAFVLLDVSPQEIKELSIESRLDYIEMMTDLD